jgi:ParB family chromosome partitioning protein
MASAKKRLGRGLGAILSEVEDAYEKDLSDVDSFNQEVQGTRVAELNVDEITPNPYQPRKQFDEEALKELSESIKLHGLLQPIVVVSSSDGYILVAGERRLRAHKLANIDTIKAIIAEVEFDDRQMRELALIENIQRENLNPIELARSYDELLNAHKLTHEELATVVHKSRAQITNTLRLLNLSEYAQEQIMIGELTQGHAKVLVGLEKAKEKVVIDSIIGQKLSVRDAENLVKKYKPTSEGSASTSKPKERSLLVEHKDEIASLLPLKHKLKNKSIEIMLQNSEDIDKFLSILKKG